MDHFAPPALVVAARDPLLPVAQRALKLVLAALEKPGEGLRRSRRMRQHDRDFLALVEDELGPRARRVEPQRQWRRQLDAVLDPDEAAARGRGDRLRRRTSVVEGGSAIEAERDLSANAPHEAHDLMIFRLLGPALAPDRFEITDIGASWKPFSTTTSSIAFRIASRLDGTISFCHASKRTPGFRITN